ncbi:MAG: hypothetical protein CSA97_01505 [Bacteroidetes bacterium]|nr:MAG: hypothetical protein CSA97_01505 [Bacteroidota bacterium]
MEVKKGKFPTTTASFKNIRTEGMYYVDKTAFVWQLVDERKIVFLSRPRRFGKSMLLNTVASYLEGRRELFEGLALYPLEEGKGEKAWVKHPVLRFDFSGIMAPTPEAMEQMVRIRIDDTMRRFGLEGLANEKKYDVYSAICELERVAKAQVAVIIDEYDSALLDTLIAGDVEGMERVRQYMRGFYRSLKSAEGSLRFMMVTGVSQIRHVGLFSGFNNIVDISFDPDYSSICGITEAEIHEYLPEQLAHMAAVRGVSTEEMMAQLKHKYDGYRFSEKEEDVYNPYGLINALCDCQLDDYWSMAGTSSSADMLIPRYDALGVLQLDGQLRARKKELSRFNFEHSDPIPFLYQTGYLSIKGMTDEGDFLLDFPNLEVRESIMEILAPRTLGIVRMSTYHGLKLNLVRALNGTDIKAFEACLQAFLASLPFDHEKGDAEKAWALRECRYRDAVHLVFIGVQGDVRVEQIAAGGISDVEVIGERMVVVLELKMAGKGYTPAKALEQAKGNGYATKHIGGERAVWAVGAVIGEKAQIEWEEELVWRGKEEAC